MYVGRFAPSPTGPLHFGSLVAAVGSYLDARTRQGKWLVRIDDIDPPREQPGAATQILQTLEAFGFQWDGEVLYQSQRSAAYDEALEQLGHTLYCCNCSRKQIAASGHKGPYGRIYPGTCRDKALIADSTEAALRVRVGPGTTVCHDLIQGKYEQNLEEDIGDFIVRRRDGLYAYHLAAAVDDAAQGISHIVRGADLLESTPRQIHLQQLLGLKTPQYAHLPIAIGSAGDKLSKQTHAAPLQIAEANRLLYAALDFLGHKPDPELQQDSLSSLWTWALANWVLATVPKKQEITVTNTQ